jgi:hypothetical protein
MGMEYWQLMVERRLNDGQAHLEVKEYEYPDVAADVIRILMREPGLVRITLRKKERDGWQR